MAWKRYRREDNRVEEIWVSLGKEREGYYTLLEGEELEGYFERLVESEKFDRPILSLLSFDHKVRYLLFTPPSLARVLEDIEEKYGTGIGLRLVYNGKKTYEREDGQKITYHSFDVEYDEELQLDTSGGKS